MTFPNEIRVGDYVQWRIPASQDVFGNSISSPDWSVVYYLRTNTGPIGATINSSAFNDGFQFTIASNVTATFTAGDWFYQAVANKSGAEKQTIYTGQFKVLESLEYSSVATNYDGRTQLRKDFDAIEATIKALVTGQAVQEYKIGNRSIKKYELSELIVIRDRYKRDLIKEEKQQLIANGEGNPHNLYIRTRG